MAKPIYNQLVNYMNRVAPRGMRIIKLRNADEIRITIKTLGKHESICHIDDFDFSTDISLQQSLEALREECAKGNYEFTTIRGDTRWLKRLWTGPSA